MEKKEYNLKVDRLEKLQISNPVWGTQGDISYKRVSHLSFLDPNSGSVNFFKTYFPGETER